MAEQHLSRVDRLIHKLPDPRSWSRDARQFMLSLGVSVFGLIAMAEGAWDMQLMNSEINRQVNRTHPSVISAKKYGVAQEALQLMIQGVIARIAQGDLRAIEQMLNNPDLQSQATTVLAYEKINRDRQEFRNTLYYKKRTRRLGDIIAVIAGLGVALIGCVGLADSQRK